ncbi:MliC family protein [Sphingopyxis sp. LARHCG72]
MRYPVAIALVAIGLAGCNASPTKTESPTTETAESTAPKADAAAAPAAELTRYSCADGSTVEARYPTPDTAQIVYKGKTVDMKVAQSASGARYVGDGWQWWTKGMTDGMLAPLKPGEDIASAAGTTCTAAAAAPAAN